MAVLWDRAKLGKGPARSTASPASRTCARSHNGTLPQGHGSPVGPGEGREAAARSTVSPASRGGARSYNGTLPHGYGNPVGPGEAREGARQIDRVARFPSLRPVPQRHVATGPWQSCGTGRSSGRGLPDRPRRLLPELAPGPTTARCYRHAATAPNPCACGCPARSTPVHGHWHALHCAPRHPPRRFSGTAPATGSATGGRCATHSCGASAGENSPRR